MSESQSAEIARLRAEVAAAEAEALRAEAEAKKAALAAALAGQAATPTPQAAEQTPAAGEAAPPAASPAADAPAPAGPAEPPAPEVTGYAATVQAGYPTTGVLPLGAFLDGEQPVAAVPIGLPLAMLNRHGLVAGATGTGKTRTLQLLAEGLSAAGVPVFLTDIKGDLTGLLEAGQGSDKLLARTRALGQEWQGQAFPVELVSLGGQGLGAPIRTTVTDFGPLLLSKVLGLNETQESSLSMIFHWADQQGLELDDIKDLRALVTYLTGEGKEDLAEIGGISSATAGVILREISALQAQGADDFFGEPPFDTADLLRTTADGRGVITALELPSLTDRPALFSTFVMWLLADLFTGLPEVGDADKPKLVFFFDEAHLLFKDASKEFLNQVVQTVRLIRSKGVGIVFVTQTPGDVPGEVLAQLGARVQHALRAFTPADAKKLKETVATFPASPLDLNEILPSLGTGEAIVTVLNAKGVPTPVAPTRLYAPQAVMGVASPGVAERVVAASPLQARYGTAVDDVSAYEKLADMATERAKQAEEAARAAAEAKAQAELAKQAQKELAAMEKAEAKRQAEAEKAARKAAEQAEKERAKAAEKRKRPIENFLKSVGSQLGREITRSIFGTRRRRR
ncbi:helicase HerA-like domain-containing protein [Buchananella hordeovulneris]|uniref:helicase HerA-like domain-containing protein n=1 Tax=Buchananella hordeovulneris TaxID=52770 RepID=UPI000F5FCF54|nr:helicase HerA-like domain-containing protein [Buchananella hordeovulneris]RRD45063.1 DUF853 family protein [Buchananella hordeovulneris]RRD52599.1 DUF853 family protein [Buchananella hordeovulneris]